MKKFDVLFKQGNTVSNEWLKQAVSAPTAEKRRESVEVLNEAAIQILATHLCNDVLMKSDEGNATEILAQSFTELGKVILNRTHIFIDAAAREGAKYYDLSGDT